MRVTDPHLDAMRAAIGPLDTESLREQYVAGRIPRADRVKDLWRRYRWDLFWAAHQADPELREITSEYLDSHIDTALRALVPELEGASA